ncbi:transcriptional regulator [Janibacter anophelis]|uniref:transcriptional regulator n=1 Tax=Janibacter anophelis TaxID=319054 RepID=UPI003F7FF598
MAYASAPELLVPHTLRVLGHATTGQVAALRSLPSSVVEEALEDARALGLVIRSSFAGSTSWYQTDRGRAKGESALAAELDGIGGRVGVQQAHADFLPLNRRIGDVMTQWQLRPIPDDPLAPNDHRDPAYDDAVIRRLTRLVDDVRPVLDRLTQLLQRFDLHQPRFDTAVRRMSQGSDTWVDSPDVASLNICWIQLHEDLLATLGIERGSDDPLG